MKVEENKKEINDLKILMNIIPKINNRTTILSKANFNFLNNRLKIILNSYKILYIYFLINIG